MELQEEMGQKASDYEALSALTQGQAQLQEQLDALYEQWSSLGEQLEELTTQEPMEKG